MMTYIVLKPNDLPKVRKPMMSKAPFISGYVIPIGILPFVAYWTIVQRPVSQPLVNEFGWMNDVHAKQKIKVPTEMRK